MSNRLQYETSPYLLQHKDNPVDWYPWCKEAFMRAHAEDKPVFLSIGYSACHWCHVMARESFEDEEIAEILNRSFISIKVDREERPDIDNVYMAACQAFTGSGGWPASIFLTPEQKPFFGGTYFPKNSRAGMVGFRELLLLIREKWENDRGSLLHHANVVVAHLKRQSAAKGAKTSGQRNVKSEQKNTETQQNNSEALPNSSETQINSSEALPNNSKPRQKNTISVQEQPESRAAESDPAAQAVALYRRTFDGKNGGFGSAPKFPAPHHLLFLISRYQRTRDMDCLMMAQITLLQMYRGGLFDHIGYGFCRYSTDDRFLVPHFEKMLYDNALLILAYSRMYAVSKKPIYLEIAEKTADFILSEMTLPEGGFAGALDADSDGEEGKYYLFTPEEIITVLGEEDGSAFNRRFDITEKGNFQGKNIPNLLNSDLREDAPETIPKNPGEISDVGCVPANTHRILGAVRENSGNDGRNPVNVHQTLGTVRENSGNDSSNPANAQRILGTVRENSRNDGRNPANAHQTLRTVRENSGNDGRNPANTHAETIRKKLRDYRKTRCSLHLDKKALTSWNSLMIAALCELYLVSRKEFYLTAAMNADQFIRKYLREKDTLFVSWCGGKRGVQGFLDDYAGYIYAILALHRATLRQEYLEEACRLTDKTAADFKDETGGFYLYGKESENLILRPKETYDGAVPSGNSLMAWNLVRLSLLTDERKYEDAAKEQLDFLSGYVSQYPSGYAMALTSMLEYEEPPAKVTVVTDGQTDPLQTALLFPPDFAILLKEPSQEQPLLNGKTTYYVCRGHLCLPPVNDPKA